jgi:hypothetical protein
LGVGVGVGVGLMESVAACIFGRRSPARVRSPKRLRKRHIAMHAEAVFSHWIPG